MKTQFVALCLALMVCSPAAALGRFLAKHVERIHEAD